MALVGAMEVASVGVMEAALEGAALEVVWVVDLEEMVASSLEMKK